jgi:hypothetical protein
MQISTQQPKAAPLMVKHANAPVLPSGNMLAFFLVITLFFL